MSKKLVITADDFGISKESNIAILKGLQEGLLTSTCVMANGEAFEHAMEEIFPQFEEDVVGVHLNIIEGKSLLPKTSKSLLCDAEGNYNNGFVSLLTKSANPDFQKELEEEFRGQIERILKYKKVSHINSHVHVHAIPNIFKIVAKLAQEYGIKYIRTQTEVPYVIPSLSKHLQLRYPVNLLKVGLLGAFSTSNLDAVRQYDLLTNDLFIGVAYTGYMDENALRYGLSAIRKDDVVAEVILHPTVDESHKDNYQEFLSFVNPDFVQEIKNSDWDLTNYSKLILGKEKVAAV